MTIRALRADERAWANAHYASIDFAATPADAIALVTEQDGARIGLGRLVAHAPGVVEMGGIWTAEAARGRGVARRMVEALLARADGTLWCIPFVHLVAFYESCGFARHAPPWPDAVAAKVAHCGALGQDVAVLSRACRAAP